MSRLRSVLIAACVLAWASSAQAAMSCLSANVSAVAIDTSNANPTVVMPTAAPANSTIWVAILNRTDGTTPTVTGSSNGALTVIGGGTIPTFFAYKVAASAATDTFTVAFGANKSSQLIAGWCSEAGGAQTYDGNPAVANDASSPYDSNAHVTTGAGGILCAYGSNNAVDFTPAGGETEISGDAGGQRLDVLFKVTSAASNSCSATAGAASVSVVLSSYKDATAGGCRRSLLGVGCHE